MSLKIGAIAQSRLAVLQEVSMAGDEKEAYLALIAQQDVQIRTLLAQGFEFVTNAFKAGAAPPGVKAKTDLEQVRSLQRQGFQVELSAAYDERGQPRPSLSAIWRKAVGRMADSSHNHTDNRPNHDRTQG